MTERSNGFDFSANPNKRVERAGEAQIYISDPDTILQWTEQNPETELLLDDHEFTSGPLLDSRFSVKKHFLDESSARLDYHGVINHNADLPMSHSVFFDTLQGILDDDFETRPLYFGETRLIYSQSTPMISAINYNKARDRVSFSNSLYQRGEGKFNGVNIALSAQPLDELDQDIIHDQFIHQVRAYVFTLNALSRALVGEPARTFFAMTPEGPLYPQNPPKIDDDDITDTDSKLSIPKIPSVPRMSEKQPVMLDDIGGLDSVRTQLRHVVFSFKHPEAMARWGADRPQGVLLYGPGGTGKTTMARALANEIGAELWEINVTDIYNKWLGDSEKNMQKIFDEAVAKKYPTVMLLDEFDALVDSSNNQKTSTVGNVVGIFKKNMNELRRKNPNIIVVATTNHMERMDESLIRAGRFDIKSYVGLPDDAARQQIFSNKIAEIIEQLETDDFHPIALDALNVPALAEATEYMTGADIAEILRRSLFAKAVEEGEYGHLMPVKPVDQEDLLALIKVIRRESSAS